ncbi:hypothetical protein [Streptomyces pinistramenti]|uniref:hypothetical protein n=1 Tax=Streptomyces pinistramenti TaxID=2884812 RepID=UPI001D05C9F0|nr:hypothetical protein [Streptomyces pinistramenti]MCB5907519.1 hypothetical protein [Streptomyces pinistramenti]
MTSCSAAASTGFSRIPVTRRCGRGTSGTRHASYEDSRWLRALLDRICRGFRSCGAAEPEATLTLRPSPGQ